MTGLWKAWKAKSRLPPLPRAPWKSRQTGRDSHIPTVPTTKADGKVENQNQVSHFPTTTILSFPSQNTNSRARLRRSAPALPSKPLTHRQNNERRPFVATPTGPHDLLISGSSPIGIDLPFQAHLALESILDFRLTSGLENAVGGRL